MRFSKDRKREKEGEQHLSRCRSSAKDTDEGREGGDWQHERTGTEQREKSHAGSRKKKKKGRIAESRSGTLARILNKYIIMPAVPSACFPTLSVVVSRVPASFFHPPRKNRSR